eukprot:GFUD01060383.1.p1 GENE.GFUD01060383.1~~GFUD01060383.1.p1  ORF type:complete len:184 (-),score=30.98 GFUD01060383.1:78-560(-)
MVDPGLIKKDMEALEFALNVDDFKADGAVDPFYINNLKRASNLNPTIKMIINTRAQEDKEQKRNKACKDAKDLDSYNDFVQVLKLDEINHDNTIIGSENLKLHTQCAKNQPNPEVNTECCEPQDTECFKSFLCKFVLINCIILTHILFKHFSIHISARVM